MTALTFHGFMDNLKSAFGLAVVPTLLLGAFGYPESVTVPVLFSSFATALFAMLFD